MASYLNNFNLFQTISLLYFLLTLTCSASSPSLDEECSALYQFKKTIIHQHDPVCAASGLQAFISWKPTSNTSDAGLDCCSWYGVECSNDHEYGHVIGLDLSEIPFCGHINSSSTLFSLVHLQRLNLAMNDFYESQIPSEIAHLKQLRSLNLSYSGFGGQIPNEISQLMHLSSLDLSWNSLKIQSHSLHNLVQNFTRLEELDLSEVDISSFIPHFLANYSSLRSIKLADCSLCNVFPTTILELPNLGILDVADNTNLTGSFPEFLNSTLLKHWTLLRLTGCSFSGSIPGSLSNLTQLTLLGLSGNKFTGVVPSLVGLSKLNILGLGGNKFEKGPLPNWLGKLTKLTDLYVYDMHINGKIPPFLANLTKLRILSMESNSLTGDIPPSFFNLTRLTLLDLHDNQLQGPISTSFSNFKSLQDLLLNSNNFSGRVDLMYLGLNQLEILKLGHNRISLVATNNYTNSSFPQLKEIGLQACNLKQFPGFLRFRDKMRVLVFSDNKIDGLVPVWIWNNSKETLQLIDFSNNSITGFQQHPRFLPWGCVEGFYISDNHIRGQLPIPPRTTVLYHVSNNFLTGEIPPLICEVKSLRVLDLSSNNMRGTLPSCFGSNSLLVLNIRRNNFHGPMMISFMNGSLLESIDLSENKFTGQLPRSLRNCTNLEVLSLGDNSFDDVFPFWLGSPAKLQVLILRSNKFHGPIQGSSTFYSPFLKLRIIDLSNNGFSGQLHQKYFQTWDAMKSDYDGEPSVIGSKMSFETFNTYSPYSMTIIHKGVKTEYPQILTIFTAIDLSCNQFEGEIPLSLENLRGIESLNLSNNQFRGRVLPLLGYLKNLESLDLSRNKLSGEIPQELVQLNFLSIFNVSFNNLDGRIPQGQQFNTFENNSYKGNPGLCGKPLSKACHSPEGRRLPPASNMSKSFLRSERTDWIFVFCGLGSGLVVGIVIGNFLYTRYGARFRKWKDVWIRTLTRN